MERCPTCQQPIPNRGGARICCLCGQQIGRHQKYRFNEDNRVQHRNCERPYDYVPKEVPRGSTGESDADGDA